MILNQLYDYIGSKNVLQKKYISIAKDALNDKEREKFKEIINYFLKSRTLEEIGDAYLLFVEDTLEETKYFVEHGKYRYSTLNEVCSSVYFNDEYMTKYMLGLIVSGYIWFNHLAIHRYYTKQIRKFSGEHFLEIGPGHGEYFEEDLNYQQFNDYLGVDLSPSSVEAAQKYITNFSKYKNYHIACLDFMQFQEREKYDGIAMSEVLEHVEFPERMLNKIYGLLKSEGKAYITTVVNAPTKDHIYLFHTIEEVLDLVKKTGFIIDDYFCVAANNVSIEKAIDKKRAINIAIVLSK